MDTDWLHTLPARVEALRAIKRFHIYDPMYYRSDDDMHSRRVAKIAYAIAPLHPAAATLDLQRLFLLGIIHDDDEIIAGDVQASAKRKMSATQLAAVNREKANAIEHLAERFPTMVGNTRYRDLLLEAQTCETLESQLVKLADRIDAWGEGLHELYAGNHGFLRRHIDPEFGPLDLPVENSPDMILEVARRYPSVRPVLDAIAPRLSLGFTLDDGRRVCERGTPHTEQSVQAPSGCAGYDFWKGLLLTKDDGQELRNLVHQQEFPPATDAHPARTGTDG